MSHLRDALAIPTSITLPEELDRAWQWMEEQGWGVRNTSGYFLTPYAGDSQRGIVFTDTEALDGGLEPGSEAARQLVPLAQIAGDGSTGALWVADGQTLFVALGSEGSAYVLARSAVDFLRLVAVGYREMTEYDLGEEPDDPEAIEAVAEFRTWVETTFAVEVPTEWPAVDQSDEFADWMRAQRGEEAAPEEATPDGLPATAVSGDVTTILAALGEPDGAQRLAALLELPDSSAKGLRAAGIELSVERGKVATVWVKLAASAAKRTYPRPDRLIHGIAPDADADQVIAVLGPPEKQGPWGVRYLIGGRYLHIQIEPGSGISMLTHMVEAP